MTARAQLQPSDLREAAVVVLNGVPVAGAAAARLGDFVARGGGLIVVAGPEIASWDGMAQLLPGQPGPPRDRTGSGGAALGSIEMTHPVFEVFRAPHSGDLSAPRFYRYRTWDVRPRPGDSAISVLARFDDGAVALAERRIGRGRVLAWGSTLDRDWTDLPVQPVFVPLVQRLVAYASAFQAPAAARTVGEVVDAEALTGAEGGPVVVAAPDGGRLSLGGGQRTLRLEQAGFYRMRPAHGKDLDVAVNVDVAESDPAAWTAAEFASLVTPPGGGPAPRPEEPALTAAERERRQSLWWWALLGAVLVLAVESVLANRHRRVVPGGRAA